MKLTAPKGTKDILPSESDLWQYIEEKAQNIMNLSNYKEMRTPIFEATELFARGVGDSTDIVNKEMYTFVQKERSLTLRPENTAGVARAYIEHGMHKLPTPLKLWYKGPMFRYERPQAGRQRQFHQLGVELYGIKEASADAEVIQIAMWYLEELGLKNLSLEINNLGCPECRTAYRNKIREVVKDNLQHFCEDCNVRYEKNPLRMLDCKNPKCRELLSSPDVDAVVNSEYICDECSTHFADLQVYLNALKIPYKINKMLVRGLDYYTKTVFEITSTNLGSQNAVCGGGRYDPLVETIGGQPTPAVGWAMGMERLISLMGEVEKTSINAFVVSNSVKDAIVLSEKLRKEGISVDFDMTARKFGKQFEKASKLGAKYAVVLGEDEIANSTVTVKNLETGEQQTLSFEGALSVLKA